MCDGPGRRDSASDPKGLDQRSLPSDGTGCRLWRNPPRSASRRAIRPDTRVRCGTVRAGNREVRDGSTGRGYEAGHQSVKSVRRLQPSLSSEVPKKIKATKDIIAGLPKESKPSGGNTLHR